MAFIIHRRNGEAVTGTVTLVQGNVLKLKLEKVDKSVELRFVSTAPNVLSVEEVSHNLKSDTWFFSIMAKSAGHASFKIETDSSANGSSVVSSSGGVTPARLLAVIYRLFRIS